MEKEFIPYEQALALKELGFDAQCFSHYRDKESLIACNQGIYGISYSDIEAPTKVILAPLYQQAFRWFREKYGLYSHVRESLAFDKTLEFVTQINGSYVNHGIEDKPINRFEIYEEAELECLKKLIEICKNN